MTQVILLSLIASVGFSGAGGTGGPDDESPFTRFQLANGVRVVAVHAPDAPRQSTFAFLPLTMTNDDAGCAQWAHLMEHLVLRSTDPVGLQAEGMTFNGETTHYYLRLETMAEPAKWGETLARHARWLSARQFDAATLEREKGMIAEEERSTAANGRTGKFALAAWNQIVQHGRPHAAVHGDIANAALERAQEYALKRVAANDQVLIATIGPAPIDEVRAELERGIGALAAQAATRPDHPAPVQIDIAKNHAGTWDLPTRHAMWFWTLPDSALETRAAAAAVAQVILSMNMQLGAGKQPLVRALAASDIAGQADERVFLIDACLADNVQPEAVWAALKPELAAMAAGGRRHPAIAFHGKMLAQMSAVKLDAAALRAQVPAHMKDVAEGIWLLNEMNLEYAWGFPAEQCVSALGNLKPEILNAVLERIVNTEPGMLVLEPAKD